MSPAIPWGEGWPHAEPLGRPDPPRELIVGPGGAAYACMACPGADRPACCRHGEWRDARSAAIRGAPARTPEAIARRGARRRWWIARALARLTRTDPTEGAPR